MRGPRLSHSHLAFITLKSSRDDVNSLQTLENILKKEITTERLVERHRYLSTINPLPSLNYMSPVYVRLVVVGRARWGITLLNCWPVFMNLPKCAAEMFFRPLLPTSAGGWSSSSPSLSLYAGGRSSSDSSGSTACLWGPHPVTIPARGRTASGGRVCFNPALIRSTVLSFGLK